MEQPPTTKGLCPMKGSFERHVADICHTLESAGNDKPGLLYRVEDNYREGIVLVRFQIIRETRCCYFLRHAYLRGAERRMYKDAIRPYAHKDIEGALRSYFKRKFRHVEHLRRKLMKTLVRYEAACTAVGVECKLPPEHWFDAETLWDER